MRSILILTPVLALACASELDTTMRVRMEEPIRMEMHGPAVIVEGRFISDEIFDRLALNEHATDWAIALFGNPTEIHPLDDGTEVWTWLYRERGMDTSMLSLTGKDKDEPARPQILTFVRFRDGVAIDKWRG